MTVSDDRIVLAFYGARPGSDEVARFFHLVVAWFTDLGFTPDRLGLSGQGSSGRMGTYRRKLKTLEALGLSALDAFNLDALMPNDV